MPKRTVLAAAFAVALAAAGVAAAAAVTHQSSGSSAASNATRRARHAPPDEDRQGARDELGQDALSLHGGQARQERLLRQVRHVLAAAHEEGEAERRGGRQGRAARHHEAEERHAPGDVQGPPALPVQARPRLGADRGPGPELLRRQVVRRLRVRRREQGRASAAAGRRRRHDHGTTCGDLRLPQPKQRRVPNCTVHRRRVVSVRRRWTFTSTRARISSGASGSRSPKGASPNTPEEARDGGRGARRPRRRQGAGTDRRPRQGRRRQARRRSRGRGGEGARHPRARHQRPRRPHALDRAGLGHRARVLPLHHLRPRREEAALHVHDAGRRRDRAGRGGEPGRARPAPRRPARRIPALGRARGWSTAAASRIPPSRSRSRRSSRSSTTRSSSSTRCSARSTR